MFQYFPKDPAQRFVDCVVVFFLQNPHIDAYLLMRYACFAVFLQFYLTSSWSFCYHIVSRVVKGGNVAHVNRFPMERGLYNEASDGFLSWRT